jgi:hypothetical protein
MLPRRTRSYAREVMATPPAAIRPSPECEGGLTLADYAALMSSLAWLVRPGTVERLLKLAEEEGVSVPEDLA